MAVALTCAGGLAMQNSHAPSKLTFASKRGPVTFDHAAHSAREANDCTMCHDRLWPQSTAKALTSSNGCRQCHTAGGRAFETTGNCEKCHPAARQAAEDGPIRDLNAKTNLGAAS